MLSEKDESRLIEIVSMAINGHMGEIKTELKYIKEKGEETFEQAKFTNGRVNKHDTEIELIKSDYKNRMLTCPRREDIDTLLSKKKNWKQTLVYEGFKIFFVVIACYVSITQASAIFKSDIKKAETEIKDESRSDDSIQNKNINSIRKAINDQNTEDAFQKSINQRDH